jgi:hypothetical protein
MPQPIIDYDIKITRKTDLISHLKTVEESICKSLTLESSLDNITKRVLQSLHNYIETHRQRPKAEYNKALDEFKGVKFTRRFPRENLYRCIAACTKIEHPRSNRWVLQIGDTQLLDQYAPYWRLVNYGGVEDRNKTYYGYFGSGHSPRARADRQRKEAFYRTEQGAMNPFKSGKKVYWMKSSGVIPPMYYLNYIAKAFEMEIEKLSLKSK